MLFIDKLVGFFVILTLFFMGFIAKSIAVYLNIADILYCICWYKTIPHC